MTIEIYHLVLLNIIIFSIGYIIGNLRSINISSNDTNLLNKYNTKNIKNSKNIDNKIIDINESKVVTKIKTDDLDRKYESLGDTKKTEDNIISSVGKLKGLKK